MSCVAIFWHKLIHKAGLEWRLLKYATVAINRKYETDLYEERTMLIIYKKKKVSYNQHSQGRSCQNKESIILK